MSEIPSMWRVELLHPLATHFPIALLVVGSLLRATALLLGRWEKIRRLDSSAILLNSLGTAAAWIAYWTGDFAEDEVNSTLCDPTVTHLHEDLAFYVCLIFSVIFVLDSLALSFARWRRQGLRVALTITALLGAGLLGYVGHLGASLVYQQGAAVYKPTQECREFE